MTLVFIFALFILAVFIGALEENAARRAAEALAPSDNEGTGHEG